MKILTTKSFDDLVSFYELEKYLNYYKLYNESEYINSYHGYEHVKKIICSINELFKTPEYFNKLTFNDVKILMIAAIFHDFNYLGIEKRIVDYDALNIESAITAFNRYVEFSNDLFVKYNEEAIRKIIKDSEYPKCLNIELSELSKFFIMCDHSMIIHKGYNFMAFAFSINEFGNTSKYEIIEGALEYIKKVKFDNEYFQNIWDFNKKDIIKGFSDFLNIIFYTYETLTYEELLDRFFYFHEYNSKNIGNVYFELV